MSSRDLNADLDRLGRFDVSGILDVHRNRVRQAMWRGDSADAERQIAWWIDALGPDRIGRAGDVVAATSEADPERQLFGAAAQDLAPALKSLADAIADHSTRRFSRWRFAAAAYASRVVRFVETWREAEEQTALARQVQHDAADTYPARYPILGPLWRFYGGVDADGSPTRRSPQRARSTFEAIRAADRHHEQQVERRNVLRDEVRRRAKRGRSDRGSASSLAEEIVDLERKLVRIEASMARNDARREARRAEAALRESLRCVAPGDGDLLPQLSMILGRAAIDRRPGTAAGRPH